MSWQRILRCAKMRQVAVIITDETGEDPMILLSLDQLEQALDGGVGPDIPPPTPAPRPTTPSFAPEEAIIPEVIEPEPQNVVTEAPVIEPEQEAAFSAITVMLPPIEAVVVAPEQPLSETSPEVMVGPPLIETVTMPPMATEAEKKQPTELSKPSPTTEMSMEERFFLEY